MGELPGSLGAIDYRNADTTSALLQQQLSALTQSSALLCALSILGFLWPLEKNQDKNFLFEYMYMYDCICAQIQWQTVVCPILFKVTI